MDMGFIDWKIKDEMNKEATRRDFVNIYGSDANCPSSIRNNTFNPNSGMISFRNDIIPNNNNNNGGFNW